MSESTTCAAKNQTSKQGSIVEAHHESGQCYFRPDTEEFVFIAGNAAGEFEAHWQDMGAQVDAFHQARERYSKCLEQYGLAAADGALSTPAQDPHIKAVTEAERELEEKRAALHKRLGTFSQKGMSYDEVVELIPVAGSGTRHKRGHKPAPYAYVKKGFFSQKKQARKLHTVAVKARDKKGGGESIYGKDKHGNTQIDTKKLTQQLTDLQWPVIKLELKDVLKWVDADFDPESLKKDCVLFEWAQKWNESLVGTKKVGGVDISAAAQLMRFVSNVGASAEFDPAKGKTTIKGEATASLALASATVEFATYVPDRLGWSLAYTNPQGNAFDMGVLRLELTAELSGFIGASVQIEGQLQVVTKGGDQQLLAGQPGGRLPRFQERRTKGAVFYKQLAAEEEGLSLSGQGFAGARAEGSLNGRLQWLKPTPPADINPRAAGLLKSTGQFTDFCNITSNIGGLAGVGLGGKFYCTFINGKFCFHIAASLCWGAGAKGGLIGEVQLSTIVEFGAWLIYQLYRLDYAFFDLVEPDAFITYSQCCVMAMLDEGESLYKAYEELSQDIVDSAKDFLREIDSLIDESRKNLEASKRRNELALNTIARQQDLLLYTPESKGMLLYLLTRHGTWDHLDLDNRGSGLVSDIYKHRKEAVICLLRSIQTKAEWRKVFCRINRDGLNMASDGDEFGTISQQEDHLVRFLQEGRSRDQDMYKAKAELAAIYDRIRTDAAWGYALAMNDSIFYQLNSFPNPHYPQRCKFGPCNMDFCALI